MQDLTCMEKRFVAFVKGNLRSNGNKKIPLADARLGHR